MPLYFIAYIAPTEINDQVKVWKDFMHEHYGCKVALSSPAHITLIPPFNMEVSKEKDLFLALKHFGTNLAPFEIAFKDFAAFEPRVIYVDVMMSRELAEAKRSLEDFLYSAGYPVKRESRPFRPHMTIANRDLQKDDFKPAWDHFCKTRYEASFMAEKVSLLRSGKDGWKEVVERDIGEVNDER